MVTVVTIDACYIYGWSPPPETHLFSEVFAKETPENALEQIYRQRQYLPRQHVWNCCQNPPKRQYFKASGQMGFFK